MNFELKVALLDHKKTEAELAELGAKFIVEDEVVDTYFNQPSGKVLKVARNNKGDWLVKLRAAGDGFEHIAKEKLDDAQAVKRKLAEEHGLRRVIQKRRKIFSYNKYEISVEHVQGLGDFLIIKGDERVPDEVLAKLGLQGSVFVAVPFCDLKPKR
ncbi:hypothetical protein CMO96_02580 [Candidatus Woesebacteria bacterium]|nr:hypothetical protein [Candidatus Woesebacteria bacterium]